MSNLREIYNLYNEKFQFFVDDFKVTFSKRVPLIGHMAHCDFDDHWRALGDVLNYLVWATMPFWLGALVLLVTENVTESAVGNLERFYYLLLNTLKDGKLLILSTALLAPAFSVALTDGKGEKPRPFPGKLSHATVVAVLMIICASLFAVQQGAGRSITSFYLGFL